MKTLLADDEVNSKKGIIPYLVLERLVPTQKYLSLRAFSNTQKRKAYDA